MAGGSVVPACVRATIAAALGALVLTATAASAAASSGLDSSLVTAGPPTSVASSADGTLLVVGLDRHFGDPGGIVAYRRHGRDPFQVLGTLDVEDGVQDVALTPDAATLVFTTRSGPGVVALASLPAGRHAWLQAQRDGDIPGSNQIVVSPDGRYAYFTNQRQASLGVARIERAASGRPSLRIIAHVALDRLPGGIAQSADGATLYVTSEIDRVDPDRVPGAGDARLGRTSCEINRAPEGVLSVVDAARATTDPAHAVRARVAAGCAPVRVALAPHGDVAWVSVRGDDRVLAFGTTKLTGDPARALVADVAAGPEPIGILVTRDGAHVIVAASDGDAGPHGPWHSGVAVFDATAVLREGDAAGLKMLPAGRRPRALYEGTDGTIWVTDYAGRAVRSLPPLTAFGATPSEAIQRSKCATYSGPNVSSKQRTYAA